MNRLIRATAANDYIKMTALTARDMVQRAQEIHGCAPTAAAALGRALCGASIMGDMMKEEEGSLTIRINGGGPIGSIIAVSDSHGNVRGCVGDPTVDLPLQPTGHLDVGGAVGRDGSFTVSKDIGLKSPYVGSTQLISGEIAEDMAAYFVESEQVPSACGLGVLVNQDLSIRAAGGFLVQLMPGASEELLRQLEDNVIFMDQLTTILDEDGIEEVFRQVLKGFEYHIVEEKEIDYKCYCSRERVAQALYGIQNEELEEMAAEGRDTEVSCRFCDKIYTFSPAELRAIIAEKAASDEEE